MDGRGAHLRRWKSKLVQLPAFTADRNPLARPIVHRQAQAGGPTHPVGSSPRACRCARVLELIRRVRAGLSRPVGMRHAPPQPGHAGRHRRRRRSPPAAALDHCRLPCASPPRRRHAGHAGHLGAGLHLPGLCHPPPHCGLVLQNQEPQKGVCRRVGARHGRQQRCAASARAWACTAPAMLGRLGGGAQRRRQTCAPPPTIPPLARPPPCVPLLSQASASPLRASWRVRACTWCWWR